MLLPYTAHTSSVCRPVANAPSALQDIASFHGYQSPLYRRILFALLCVLSCGVLFIFSRWYLRLRVLLTLVPCPLGQADYVVVTVRGAGVPAAAARLFMLPSALHVGQGACVRACALW